VLGFLIRRGLLLASAMLIASFIVFSSLYLVPGDPVAALTGGRTLPPEALAELRAQYQLDDPFLQRYAVWLGDVLRGDLGSSVVFRQDVASMMAEKGTVTLQLVLLAAMILVVSGVGLGVLSGLRKGIVDKVIVGGSAFLAAVPPYMAALVLLSIFSVGLGWFPALGAGDGFASRLHHLSLPAIALALSSVAVVARVTRVAIRGEASREHVQTAISRGLAHRSVVRRHVVRNALMPITTVVGVAVASLLAVSAVVEQAFSLDGLGSALVQAALARDMAVVQAITLLYVAAFVVTTTLVDVLHASLDPRIKARGATS
jgi:peptide/nickel transport system permease protein